MEFLLHLPHNPNLFDACGFAALVQASQHGHVEVVALLLEGGADTDLAETRELTSGLTALTAASDFGSVEVARLLLEAGADTDLADHSGGAPLMVASEQKRRRSKLRRWPKNSSCATQPKGSQRGSRL